MEETYGTKDCHGANLLDAFVFHKLNKKERVGVSW